MNEPMAQGWTVAEIMALLTRKQALEDMLQKIVDDSCEHSEASWLAALDMDLIDDARALLRDK